MENKTGSTKFKIWHKPTGQYVKIECLKPEQNFKKIPLKPTNLFYNFLDISNASITDNDDFEIHSFREQITYVRTDIVSSPSDILDSDFYNLQTKYGFVVSKLIKKAFLDKLFQKNDMVLIPNIALGYEHINEFKKSNIQLKKFCKNQNLKLKPYDYLYFISFQGNTSQNFDEISLLLKIGNPDYDCYCTKTLEKKLKPFLSHLSR